MKRKIYVIPFLCHHSIIIYVKYFKVLQFDFTKKMWFNKFTKPHFVAYQTNFLPNKYVKKSKSLPILAWVVNSKDEEDRIKKYVNNIIFENFNPFEE